MNKVVVITGAAGGIGTEITKRFLREGAKAVAVDISTAALEKLYVDLRKPENLLIVKTDISSEESTQQLFHQIKDKWNAIDIIINNAGWFPFLEFDKISYADWRKVMGINLDGIPDYPKFTTTIETERCRDASSILLPAVSLTSLQGKRIT